MMTDPQFLREEAEFAVQEGKTSEILSEILNTLMKFSTMLPKLEERWAFLEKSQTHATNEIQEIDGFIAKLTSQKEALTDNLEDIEKEMSKIAETRIILQRIVEGPLELETAKNEMDTTKPRTIEESLNGD